MKSRLGLCSVSLLSLVSLLLSPHLTPTAHSAQNINDCPAPTATERARISRVGSKVVRQKQKLTIRTRKNTITFRDVCKGDDFAHHTLKAYYAKLQYFLVQINRYEDTEYILVNEKTGAKTSLHAVPVFSPDRQRFTAMVIDELNGNTSIEIYRLTAAGAQREYQNFQVKGPANPVWRNNSTIDFQRTLSLGSEAIPAVLKRTNGLWKLT